MSMTLRSFYPSRLKTQLLPSKILRKDLLCVAAWCCTNNLLINADKTVPPDWHTPDVTKKLPEDMSLFFLGKLITPVTTAKDLGVTL